MLDHQEFQPERHTADAGNEVSANQGGDPGSGPPPIIAPPQTPQAPPPNGQPSHKSSERRERIKLGLEVVGLLALIIYTIFTILQWAQVRWTNRLTREAINDQFSETERSLYLACLSARIAQNTLYEVQAGGTDSHNLAVGSITQAAAVTRAEAAQINVVDNNPQSLAEGDQVRVPLTIKNAGSSAALDIKVKGVVKIVTVGQEPEFDYPDDIVSLGEMGYLAAGDTPKPPFPLGLVKDKKPVLLEESDAERLMNNKAYISTYGRITYRDIFGTLHWVQYCGSSSKHNRPNEAGYPKCAAYNKADIKQLPKAATETPRPESPQISCPVPRDQ